MYQICHNILLGCILYSAVATYLFWGGQTIYNQNLEVLWYLVRVSLTVLQSHPHTNHIIILEKKI